MSDITAKWIVRDGIGGQSGYRLTRASATLTKPNDAYAHLEATIPGTPVPVDGKNDPNALPWVWFSPSSVEGGSISISIMQSGDKHDGWGRRFDPTKCFFLAIPDVLQAYPSYVSLYIGDGGAGKTVLPTPNNEPAMLNLDPLDTAAIAGRDDLTRLAAIASLLLTGAVSLTASAFQKTSERAEHLDAIAAMLPFGFRVDLAAASWMMGDNTNFRLSFGAIPRNDRISVDWDKREQPELTEGLARDYFDRLSLLLKLLGPAKVLEHLAQDRQPRSFQQPDAAMDYLAPLAAPIEVWIDILSRRADPAEVRAIVAAGDTPVHAIDDYAIELLFRGNAADVSIVTRLLGDAVSDRVGVAIATSVITHRCAKSWSNLARKHDLLDMTLTFALGGSHGIDMLRSLLKTATAAPVPGQLVFPDLDIRGPLTDADLASMALPAPGDAIGAFLEALENSQSLPRTQDALQSNPAWVYLLALKLLKYDPPATVVQHLYQFGVDLLNPERELQPLKCILASDQPAQLDALATAHSLQPSQAHTLLEICLRCNRPGDAITMIWHWLPGRSDRLSPFDREQIGKVVGELRARRDIGQQQRVQLLLADLLLAPNHLDAAIGMRPDDEYPFEERFRAAFYAQSFEPARDAALRSLINQIENDPDWASDGQAGQILDMLLIMSEPAPSRTNAPSVDGARPAAPNNAVCRVVANAVIRMPALRRDPAFRKWKTMLQQGGYTFYLALASIQEQTPDDHLGFLTGQHVADALTFANRERGDFDHLVGALKRTNPQRDPIWVLQFFTGVISRLAELRIPLPQRQAFITWLLQMTANEPLNEQWGAPLGALTDAILPDLLSFLISAAEKSPNGLSDDYRKSLRDSAARIETATKESRFRNPLRGREH